MHVVVLSPHRDDAAFSCGLLLTQLLRAGATVELVNVCTESDYAPYLETADEPRVRQVSRARRDEDLHFLQTLRDISGSGRCSMTDLHWLDSPLRLGIATDRVLQAPDAVAADVTALAEALRPWSAADVVLSPLALGNHIDHRLVRDAAFLAFSANLGFYEDLPYACWVSDEVRHAAVEDVLRFLNAETALWQPPWQDDADLKKRYSVVYSSQIAEDLADRMAQDAARQRGERMHLPPALVAALDQILRPLPK